MSLLATFLEEGLNYGAATKPLKEVWLAIRTDGPPDSTMPPVFGNGSRENPYDASTANKFDTLMANLNLITPETIVHLGPGTFRTKGGGGAGTGGFFAWKPQTGQRIVGSGMFATTLLFTIVPFTEPIQERAEIHYAVRAHQSDFLENFEVSDLTIDCNMQNQPSKPGFDEWPKLAAAAMSVTGANIRVRRVRVINFGTRTPLVVNGTEHVDPGQAWECFPVRLEGRDVANPNPGFHNVLEDCIFEQPYIASARETTCTVLSSGVFDDATPPQKLHLEPVGCVLRNCYFNFEFKNPRPSKELSIESITFSGSGSNVTANNAYPDKAIQYSNCTSAKSFNNQDTAGNVLRGYNTTTQLYRQELEDPVQDVLLPV